jgi:OmpA-OmpF porin, OOP family
MKQFLILSIFLLISIDLTAQRGMVKTYYKNGQLESKGFVYTYSMYYDVKNKIKSNVLTNTGKITKKIKEWVYYYPNGQISRIENYKIVIDKNPYDLRDGNWIYYNAQGIKYREESYKEGTLTNSIKEIYKGTHLAGKFTLHNGIADTILSEPFTIGNNLILNPDFSYFYYKPVPVVQDGRSKIDEWIPFWKAPGNYTPDYLSNIRSIDVLSSYYLFDFPLPQKFNYAGLGIYKDSLSYSEYIQGKLVKPLTKGQKYCLKVSIALSSYSGFSVNRLAFHLSPKPVLINEINESSYKPQVILSTVSVNNKEFTTLCEYFIAEGDEQFISIGRFCSPNKLVIIRRENFPQTQFGIEKSAYYLLESVDIHEIQDTIECYCKRVSVQYDTIKMLADQEFPLPETDFNKLKSGNSVILKNVNFEFNSYSLQHDAENVLSTLLNFLIKNPEINIQISGHTDDIGTEEYNLELSINRAKTVYNWLIAKGIEAKRLKYAGFGKSVPLYYETSERFRELNRRVEVKIIRDY